MLNRIKSTSKKITQSTGKVLRKAKGSSFSNFYKGQSLPVVIYKGGRFVVRHGPVSTYKVLRRELLSDGIVRFPNGLVSDVDLERINIWYRKHARKVSIVIPSYNDYPLLKACLDSIAQTVEGKFYNVIVVDDYCMEPNRKLLRGLESENVEVIYRDKNGGFAKAVNTGFKLATKKYPKQDIVLLNSDTVAHKSWLASLQHGAYEFDKKVGIVGPKLLYPDGRIQSGGSFRNTDLPEWFDHYYRFQPSDYGPANVAQYCIGVTGACWYVKATTMRKIGLLDEGFPFAFEDMDYCVRAWDQGIRVLYYPAATMTHVESAIRGKDRPMTDREKASLRYFWKKWGAWFDDRKVTNQKGQTRIIYVLQSTGISGGIRVVFEHLNRLQARGYDTELWALDNAPTWMKLDVPVKTFKNYQQMIKSLETEDAIKVATWWETALPVWLSSVKHGIPVFVVQEIESSFYPGQPEIQKSVVSCYRKEFNNITSAEFTLDEIRALGLDAKLIPCGYDDNVYKQLPNTKHDSATLLALGRSFFQKNFKQIFEAWKSMGADPSSQPHLLLFGSEPQISKWDKAIEYINRPTDNEANELYNRATIFAQTSYHEGFCLPIIEAMAAGCPVICTDSNGNRGFSDDGKNCIMVEADDVAGLAAAIKRVIGDPKLQKKLISAGLKTAQSYTWDNVIGQLDSFYKKTSKQPKQEYMKKAVKKYV
ncbi:MAG TPA: glycosyltransferase [Patescibacteria group bacterium]|nr:glycosyltransferase [Patescibacteria group bacterium]